MLTFYFDVSDSMCPKFRELTTFLFLVALAPKMTYFTGNQQLRGRNCFVNTVISFVVTT